MALVDKLSFLSLLTKATFDDSDPTPGYMLPEINKITFESGACCEDLVEWLVDRLSNKSCHVKLKVLRVMKYLVTNGHPQFRHSLRKKSQLITETRKHSGPPDPLHGSAPYLSVRQEAKELSSLLFTVDENDSSMVTMPTISQDSRQMYATTGMGSSGSGTMQGFGNTAFSSNKSFVNTIRDGLQDLVSRTTDVAYGHDDVTFETSSHVSRFPNYRPVAVPASDLHRSCSPAESVKKNVPLSKAPTKHRRGVAGGGWEDEDIDEHGAAVTTQAANDSIGSSSAGLEHDTLRTSESNGNGSCLEDWSIETRLVDDFTQITEDTVPRRNELDCFVASCSNVNCDKVVELLCHRLDNRHQNLAMRLLLALEWLLMTDLVAPDHVAIVCSRMLTSLYTSDTVNSAVQQKARKIIRILEKISPKQAHLFSSVSACKSTSPANTSKTSDAEMNHSIATAESSTDNSTHCHDCISFFVTIQNSN